MIISALFVMMVFCILGVVACIVCIGLVECIGRAFIATAKLFQLAATYWRVVDVETQYRAALLRMPAKWYESSDVYVARVDAAWRARGYK